jgi:hypothetical protein
VLIRRSCDEIEVVLEEEEEGGIVGKARRGEARRWMCGQTSAWCLLDECIPVAAALTGS